MQVKPTIAIATLIAATTLAFAQQSEFQTKLQEDLATSKKQVIASCGTTDKVALKWTGGKLPHDPRERTNDQPSISILCKMAIEATTTACQKNAVVKEKVGKVTEVACAWGKGPLGYKLASSTLTLTIDRTFTKDNPATQRDALSKKLRAELDN